MSHDVRHTSAASQPDHGASCPWPGGTTGRPGHGLGGKSGATFIARTGSARGGTANSAMHTAGAHVYGPPYTSLCCSGGAVPAISAGPGTSRNHRHDGQGTLVESSGADLVLARRRIAGRSNAARPSGVTGIPE